MRAAPSCCERRSRADASHCGLRTCHPASLASKREWRRTMLLASLPRVAVAVIEAPGATFIRRQDPGQRDAHAMIARGKIVLAVAVAIAEFQQAAHTVDA